MKICIDCANGTKDGDSVECSAVQIGDLAALIGGKPEPGAKMNAGLVRLNPALCGTHAQWWEARDVTPPESPDPSSDQEVQDDGRPAA